MGETENKALLRKRAFEVLSAEFKKVIWRDSNHLQDRQQPLLLFLRNVRGLADRASGFCDSVWR